MTRRVKTAKQTIPIQQTSALMYVILLVVLSALNVWVFFLYGDSSVLVTCTTDSLIEAVAVYLTNNGKSDLVELLPSQCAEYGFAEKSETELENVVRELIIKCQQKENSSMKLPQKKEPLLTLFTTFAGHIHTDSEKNLVHNNTLANWSALKPSVNLILFSNESYWATVAEHFGWDVIKPFQDENSGTNPPVLKDMFRATMERYDTLWYGYVNADILFTRELISHLQFFTQKYETTSARLFLTGRRTNVANLTHLNPVSDVSIKSYAEDFGELYREDAEDFFITTKSFPWQSILPVVVGRPGYDNWLVGEARCRLNTTVIDVTKTLLAFHQTTRKGGNSEGHSHPNKDINFKVLKSNNIVPNFIAGLTDCIIFNTYRSFCDDIEIAQRTRFGPGCDCKRKLKHTGS